MAIDPRPFDLNWPSHFMFQSWRDQAEENALRQADAVLDALMEPTKEMIIAGNDEIRDHIDFYDYDSGAGYSVEPQAAYACIRGMIKAAKGGK